MVIALLTLLALEAAARIALRLPGVAAGLDRKGSMPTYWARMSQLSGDPDPLRRPATVPLVADATLGWRARPGRWGTDAAPVTVDDDGFRHVPDVPHDGPRERVVVFGDSYGWGDEVGDDDVWANVLARRRPDLDVDNRSMLAWGHDQMVLALEADAPRALDAAVLLYVSCDTSRNTQWFDAWFRPHFVLTDGVLRYEPPREVDADAAVRHFRFRPRLFDLPAVVTDYAGAGSDARDAEETALTEALLRRFVTSAATVGATPVVLRAPIGRELVTGADGRAAFRYSKVADTAYAAVCADPAVHCVDAAGSVAAALDGGARFEGVGHWTPAIQAVIADVADGALPVRGP
ncbi:MAG: hypothetical protein H6733_12105 [Alphaproteobacteria bacterium]|nr:hypothetical protein [Alphaproteobacteria bacterium]